MLSHIQNVKYVRGSTNTGGALESLRKNIFTHEGGDRNDVPDVAIVILDGKLNLHYNSLFLNKIQTRKNYNGYQS